MGLESVVKEVIDKIPKNVTIHIYRSYSTDSVYLKFDWGVMNTLRISNHNGKSYLKYMYEINSVYDGVSKEFDTELNIYKYKYGVGNIDVFIEDFIKNYNIKMEKINSYDKYIGAVKRKIDYSKGFWSGAKLVRLGVVDVC